MSKRRRRRNDSTNKKKSRLNTRLKTFYYNPKLPSSFGGLKRLKKASGEKEKDIKQWLSFEKTYTLHKPVRYKFRRRKTIVAGIDDQWQADLIVVNNLKGANQGYVYLLTCVDVFSRYAWVKPLKDKTGQALAAAFQEIFQEGRKPDKLQTDKGTEFKNKVFQSFLKKNEVHFFTTENEEIKAAIVERFNRTLKEKMWRYFTRNDTTRYTDVLPQIVLAYNRAYHRSIGAAPADVNETNEEDIWYRLYGQTESIQKPKLPKLKPGDRVRISKSKRVFKKGYLPSWTTGTTELFTVKTINKTDPITYIIKDDHDEALKGSFYEQELQKVGDAGVYEIETVLDQRVSEGGRQEYLVKWMGYDPTFNSWIPDRAVVEKKKKKYGRR